MQIFLAITYTLKNTSIISLSMVGEDDAYLYAEAADYRKCDVDREMYQKVIQNLKFNESDRFIEENPPNIEIKDYSGVIQVEVENFLEKYENPEIWVSNTLKSAELFADLLDNDLPIYDIGTMMKLRGIDVPKDEFTGGIVEGEPGNALYEARLLKECYQRLQYINDI